MTRSHRDLSEKAMAMAESVLQDAYEGEDREGGGGQLCLRHSSRGGVCCYTQQQPDPLFRGDYFPCREGGDEPMGWWVCYTNRCMFNGITIHHRCNYMVIIIIASWCF
mmetsp:Transcript_23685/g.50679  ORF Transcript_23685/g.50679 Transcript_23685/m.50679 type:complete len:108 (+) Transcript_23685:245-568(+)